MFIWLLSFIIILSLISVITCIIIFTDNCYSIVWTLQNLTVRLPANEHLGHFPGHFRVILILCYFHHISDIFCCWYIEIFIFFCTLICNLPKLGLVAFLSILLDFYIDNPVICVNKIFLPFIIVY